MSTQIPDANALVTFVKSFTGSTNDDEIKQTTMLTLPLDEASVKISSKFPKDDEEDLAWPIWAGNIPIEHRYGTPIPDPRMTTAHPLPEYLKSWPEGRT